RERRQECLRPQKRVKNVFFSGGSIARFRNLLLRISQSDRKVTPSPEGAELISVGLRELVRAALRKPYRKNAL
ncbi:MAG: hypothetical protein ACI4P3_05820, partial [Candidatus Spyradosoma sp.]